MSKDRSYDPYIIPGAENFRRPDPKTDPHQLKTYGPAIGPTRDELVRWETERAGIWRGNFGDIREWVLEEEVSQEATKILSMKRRGKERLDETLEIPGFVSLSVIDVERNCLGSWLDVSSTRCLILASPVDRLKSLKGLSTFNSDSAEAHMYMGKIEMQTASYDQYSADDYLRKYDASSWGPQRELCKRAYNHVKKRIDLAYTWAIDEFDKAIGLEPENPHAHLDRSSALIRLGVSNREITRDATEEAFETCGRAINLDPNYTELFNNKGFALRMIWGDDFDLAHKALSAFNEAIRLDSKTSTSYRSVVVHENKGELLEEMARKLRFKHDEKRAKIFEEEARDTHKKAGELHTEVVKAERQSSGKTDFTLWSRKK